MPQSKKLHAVIAAHGVASRRQAEALIKAGRVTVNHRLITNVAERVDPAIDEIAVDGQPLEVDPGDRQNYLFHKPTNVISTTRDDRGRRTILDFFPKTTRLFPVGRLDRDTTGLIFVTNDGALAQKIAHPRSALVKTYEVRGWVNRPVRVLIERLAQGIELTDGLFRPDRVTYLKRAGSREFIIELEIHEGRNRVIRRACAALGFEITHLTRTKIGPIALGNLPVGTARPMTAKELAALETSLKERPPVDQVGRTSDRASRRRG